MITGSCPNRMGETPICAPFASAGDEAFSLIQPERGAPQVHVLSELARAGIIPVACGSAVRLVHIVLDYRIKRMKIELRREQLGLTPGSQSAQAASARHAARRPKRS
jgi:hypothetical protein